VITKVIAILFTLLYIYPINEVLFLHAGGDHSSEEIRRMVDTWIVSDRIRFAIGIVGFLSLLRALSLPVRDSSK